MVMKRQVEMRMNAEALPGHNGLRAKSCISNQKVQSPRLCRCCEITPFVWTGENTFEEGTVDFLGAIHTEVFFLLSSE